MSKELLTRRFRKEMSQTMIPAVGNPSTSHRYAEADEETVQVLDL
jgi:hypothetical protein